LFFILVFIALVHPTHQVSAIRRTTEMTKNRGSSSKPSSAKNPRAGMHPLARHNSDGDTDDSYTPSVVPSDDDAPVRSDEDAEPLDTSEELNPHGLGFIVWTEKHKTNPRISALTPKQIEQLVDLDQQGVRFETIMTNVRDGSKGNVNAARSKYLVKAQKFLTTISPNITIKEAAAHPVLRKSNYFKVFPLFI